MKSVYFVDTSTVDLNVFINNTEFNKIDRVIIVYYSGCEDLNLDCLHKLISTGVTIETINSTKVDVDKILLISLIKKCCKECSNVNYYIVSNDRGFNNLPQGYLPNAAECEILECYEPNVGLEK